MLTLTTLDTMPAEVDTVNMAVREPVESRPYHHGRLPEALIDAAFRLARTQGPDAVVLRAAAREVGVSHNAAYRHFADRDALLRAVCERCMAELARLMEARIAAVADDTDPAAAAWGRLAATGRAYVEFATTEPGWFRTAFAVPRALGHLRPGEGAGDSGRNPYQLLGACLDDLVATGGLPAERRPGAEIAAWSAVHGLASLLIDGPLRDLPAADRAAAMDKVLSVVSGGL
jgi:AcrR family transcriptional regulator